MSVGAEQCDVAQVSEVEHNYTALQQVVQALQAVRSAGYVAVIAEPFPLSRLVPEFSNLYMTYNGSLTTPPCSESVTWVIRKEPLTVSRHQVCLFRMYFPQEGVSARAVAADNAQQHDRGQKF